MSALDARYNAIWFANSTLTAKAKAYLREARSCREQAWYAADHNDPLYAEQMHQETGYFFLMALSCRRQARERRHAA